MSESLASWWRQGQIVFQATARGCHNPETGARRHFPSPIGGADNVCLFAYRRPKSVIHEMVSPLIRGTSSQIVQGRPSPAGKRIERLSRTLIWVRWPVCRFRSAIAPLVNRLGAFCHPTNRPLVVASDARWLLVSMVTMEPWIWTSAGRTTSCGKRTEPPVRGQE